MISGTFYVEMGDKFDSAKGTEMPAGAFGYVPTPALVAPIEFTMKLSDYAALGGHMDYVKPLSEVQGGDDVRQLPWQNPIPGPRA